MLKLTIPASEYFDEETQEFSSSEEVTLELVHSLVSLSKWEEIHRVPFLSNKQKTQDDTLDYIWCMVITPDVERKVLDLLTQDHFKAVNDYIESPATATTFAELPGKKVPGEVITSELIYYWMVAFTIPFECQTWHLSRLFALIRICNVKQNTKQKKMSRREIAERNMQLNAARKAEFGTSG
jgi:hypothetical protein